MHAASFLESINVYQKNPRAHKNKIGTPPKPETTPSPPKRGILWTWRFSCRKNALGAHRIGAAVSGPRIADTNSGSGKRGVEFKGGSHHDRNRHNRNRQNRQNRHSCLLVLYFAGEAKGGQGAFQNRHNRQNPQNHHEGYPP